MSAESEVREVIQVYFDSMFESDDRKVFQAFHPNARITGYSRGALQEMDVAVFAAFVRSQKPSAKEKGESPVLEVLSVDVAGLPFRGSGTYTWGGRSWTRCRF